MPTRPQFATEGEFITALRDYFAGRAMQGILADPDVSLMGENKKRLAATAYEIAEAMLEVRGA